MDVDRLHTLRTFYELGSTGDKFAPLRRAASAAIGALSIPHGWQHKPV